MVDFHLGVLRLRIGGDLGPGVVEKTAVPSSGANGFLLKLAPDSGFTWVQTFPVVGASTVAVSPDGDTIVVGGAFGGTRRPRPHQRRGPPHRRRHQ